jgi:beta-lactamase regulating signal transducer with metallopeptidase domain
VNLLSVWWTWLAVASVQAAIAIPLAALVDRAIGTRRWPSFQAALWTMVIVRLMTPPELSGFLPLPVVERLPDASPLAIDARAPEAVIQVAFAVWLAGVAVSAGWLAWRSRRMRAFWARGAEAPADLAQLAREAAARIGLTRVPAIFVHDAIAVPATIGVRDPIVVLPRPLVDASRRDIEHVLLHELAHIRRRDALRAIGAAAVQVLYWFHPLVWLVRARLAALRELACDRDVTRVVASRDEYRRTLIRLARSLVDEPALVAGARLFARRSDLLVRLELLAAPARPPSRLGRACVVLMCVAAMPAFVIVDATAARVIGADGDAAQSAGCLRLRYAVYAALAKEAADKGQ